MKTRLLSLFVALLATTALWAYDLKFGNLYYNILTDSTAGVVRDDSYASLTTVTIPSTFSHNGTIYTVTEIKYWAFKECAELTSVTIPGSVTYIGGSAFAGCSSLATITIPNSVTNIGQDAFEGTPWYENQPDGAIYINNMLYNYKGTMPSNTSITVKEGTVSICQYAFYEQIKLVSITFPNSLKSIGKWAFADCNGLTSITIPYGVTTIGEQAFRSCDFLTSITIPNSVTSIEEEAFYSCRSLTSITIPNSVTSIGQDAFAGCTSLASITIPSKVTSIENGAFKDCTGLTSMTICAETPPTIYSDTYKNVPTDIVVYVPCNKQNTYAMAEWWYAFGNYNETMAAMVNLKSQDDQGTVVMKKQATCEDNTAIIEAIAKENFCFARWSDGNTDNPRTIIVTGDTTYTAEFKSNLCTITVIYDTQKGCVSGGGNYTYGTQVRLEASANSGYEFVKWSDGKTYNPYIFTATKDLTLEAEFRSTTAVENVSVDTPAPRKILRNGQVLILRNGKTFTPTGVEVR